MHTEIATIRQLTEAAARRRAFLQGFAVCAFAFATGSVAVASPAQSPTPPESYLHITLNETEVLNLNALGEMLLPGAAQAGMSRYIDTQLASDEPLLLLKYVDFPGSLTAFYRGGLGALEQCSQRLHQRAFHALAGQEQSSLLQSLLQQQLPEWQGPPGPLFYFVLRNDALDVCYGTEAGFAQLGVPYMAHIAPERPW
jgi:hypothetical protein